MPGGPRENEHERQTRVDRALADLRSRVEGQDKKIATLEEKVAKLESELQSLGK